MTIEGNNEADRLADQGKCSTLATPNPARHSYSSATRAPRRRPKESNSPHWKQPRQLLIDWIFPCMSHLFGQPLRKGITYSQLLTSLLSDGGVSTPSNSDNDTDTWNTFRGSVKQPAKCAVVLHGGQPLSPTGSTGCPPSKTPEDPHSGRKGYAWTSPGPRGRQAFPRPTPPEPSPPFS